MNDDEKGSCTDIDANIKRNTGYDTRQFDKQKNFSLDDNKRRDGYFGLIAGQVKCVFSLLTNHKDLVVPLGENIISLGFLNGAKVNAKHEFGSSKTTNLLSSFSYRVKHYASLYPTLTITK